MAIVARGIIDETSNAMAFFGKTFYFYYLFSAGAYLLVYLLVSLFVNLPFLS